MYIRRGEYYIIVYNKKKKINKKCIPLKEKKYTRYKYLRNMGFNFLIFYTPPPTFQMTARLPVIIYCTVSISAGRHVESEKKLTVFFFFFPVTYNDGFPVRADSANIS